jgi:hypothetical protein
VPLTVTRALQLKAQGETPLGSPEAALNMAITAARRELLIAAITTARRKLLIAGLECHQAKRDQLAAALRSTSVMHERSELLVMHADACRCVAAFEADLAKA